MRAYTPLGHGPGYVDFIIKVRKRRRGVYHTSTLLNQGYVDFVIKLTYSG